MNLKLFKARKRKVLVLISITWNADSAVPKVAFKHNFVCYQIEMCESFKI